MILTKLSVDGFKNLQSVSLTPDPTYNLIFGENAQGKTNLLEAVWALTGCRSFRGTRERDYLAFAGGSLEVCATVQDARREQTIRLAIKPGNPPEKKLFLNEIPRKGSELFEAFHCVAFTPDDLALVDGGPERRRTFLDLCSAQLHAPMLSLVRRYQLALHQRNSVLKQMLPDRQAAALLDVWDAQLVRLGTEIATQRAAYVQRLSEVCVPLYGRISGGRETISLRYHSSVFGRDAATLLQDAPLSDLQEQYRTRLEQSRESDMLLHHTGTGIHRDDLALLIEGKSARDFGSQGQKKSLALSLKLAQAEIYSKRRRESPVVLLDDVMGELDEARQAVVSTIVEQMQVFVTTCHPQALHTAAGGKRFLLQEGKLAEQV